MCGGCRQGKSRWLEKKKKVGDSCYCILQTMSVKVMWSCRIFHFVSRVFSPLSVLAFRHAWTKWNTWNSLPKCWIIRLVSSTALQVRWGLNRTVTRYATACSVVVVKWLDMLAERILNIYLITNRRKHNPHLNSMNLLIASNISLHWKETVCVCGSEDDPRTDLRINELWWQSLIRKEKGLALT